jgi:hypothetical protein
MQISISVSDPKRLGLGFRWPFSTAYEYVDLSIGTKLAAVWKLDGSVLGSGCGENQCRAGASGPQHSKTNTTDSYYRQSSGNPGCANCWTVVGDVELWATPRDRVLSPLPYFNVHCLFAVLIHWFVVFTTAHELTSAYLLLSQSLIE